VNLSWECFPMEESWGLRPAQGDKNGFCSATALH
jgi:hypothetical protein